MPRRVIGIDIGPATVHAVQVLRSGQRLVVERAADAPLESRPDKANASEAIRRLLDEHGFSARAPITLAAAPDRVFCRVLETDLARVDDVRRVLAFELEEDLPLPAERLSLDVAGAWAGNDGGRALLVAAAERQAVKQAADLAAGAGRECIGVGMAACALLPVARANVADPARPFLFVHLSPDRAILGIGMDRTLRAARTFPLVIRLGGDTLASIATDLIREGELTWRDALAETPPRGAPLALTGEDLDLDRIAERLRSASGFAPVVADPFAGMAKAPGVEAAPALAVAAGAARRMVEAPTDTLNFLATDLRGADEAAGMRHAIGLLGVMAAVAVLLWISGIFIKQASLEKRKRNIEGRMTDVFRQTFPGEAIVGPDLQLAVAQDALAQLRRQQEVFGTVLPSGLSPLAALQALSAAIPRTANVTLTEMDFAGNAIRLRGTTDSYKSVEDLRARLLAVPGFRSVEIRDTGGGRDNRAVPFTLLIATR